MNRKINSIQKPLVLLFLLWLFPLGALAQSIVKGTVSDEAGEPIIGATVKVQGSNEGAITDFDGNFSVKAASNATLVISYIGYQTVTANVGGKSTVNVTMKEDNTTLNDVVVIGYGTMKKKLVTGATVQVKGDDIAKLSTTDALTAMQSQTPGVMILQNSGQAGEGYKVNIRGIGTTGDSNPLYVIDGVAGGNLSDLNPSDIESIDVLKDAASAAIYGARAANGVILVTTKQGKSGKIQLNYDGYVGWQYMAKAADVLNAQEYMYSSKLREFNGGASEMDWEGKLPADIYEKLMNGWTGVNWMDASYHKGAITTNHSIGLVGGNDVSNFNMGFAYTKQNGIFGGEMQSKFDRFNIRINSSHVLLRSKNNQFDVIKVGENVNINRRIRRGISQGSMYWNNIHDLMIANPLLPIYDADGNYYTNKEMAAEGWTLGSVSNPLAIAATTSQGLNESNNWGVNVSAFLEIQPIQRLIIRSQVGYRFGYNSYRAMTRVHASGTNVADQDNASQSVNSWSRITLDNTVAYTFDIQKHNINVVAGQSIEKNTYGENLNAAGNNLLFGDSWEHAYVGNAQILKLADLTSIGGSPSGDNSLASFFGRVSYNYDEKYMFQATLRADGSSNFARGHRWGVFPSVSAGWVLTNEKFMEKTKSWLDFFKIRASWGQNGNCNIPNFQYLTQVGFSTANSYFYGLTSPGTPGLANHEEQTTGGSFNVLGNPELTWETSEQIDLGIDARFLGGRLGFVFDWYKKSTKDWLVRAPILGVYGIGAPYINGGDVKNTGIEVALNWNDNLKCGLRYGASINLSYNKNEVTKLANAEGIMHGPGAVWHQLEGEVFRAQVGEPIGFFYGYKTDGVFQNGEQIARYAEKIDDKVHGGSANLRPGDLIFVDVNGDGAIDDNDRTNIGDPHPSVTMGVNANAAYKGFDFTISGNGAFGQKILRTWANQDFLPQNLTKKIVYGSWKGEGTSNKLPIFDGFDTPNWKNMSSAMLENGSYFRISNITLGYDFKTIWKSCPLQQLRLYFAINNLYTFTSYTGMDPEVGGQGGSGDAYGWAAGIDTGVYPAPRTYLVGVNIKF